MPTKEEYKANLYQALDSLYKNQPRQYRVGEIRIRMIGLGLSTTGVPELRRILSGMSNVERVGHGYIPKSK